MASIIKLQEFGNQIALIYDDGTRQFAYPTMGGLWLVKKTIVVPPESGEWLWPFNPDTEVSSEYGPRTGVGVGTFHEGIDFSGGTAVRGADNKCIHAGTVESVSYNSGYGNYIVIHHGTFGAYDLKSVYGHFDTAPVFSTGDSVTLSQVLGALGSSGDATGPHLHLETHKCTVGGGIIHNTNDDSNPRTAVNPRDFMAEYA